MPPSQPQVIFKTSPTTNLTTVAGIGIGVFLGLVLLGVAIRTAHRRYRHPDQLLLRQAKLEAFTRRRADTEAEADMDDSGRAARDLCTDRSSVIELTEIVAQAKAAAPLATDADRFSIRTVVYGRQADAALGIEHYLCVSDAELRRLKSLGTEGIRAEFEALGDRTGIECMRYVLDGRAGTSSTLFPNSPFPLDCGPNGLLDERRAASGLGKVLDDFSHDPNAQLAKLQPEHVAALRIYTTAAFSLINAPLRDLERKAQGQPHPLMLTAALIRDAVVRLRAVGAHDPSLANAQIDLWRGLKGVRVAEDFIEQGGTELAPMSTTSDLKVALKYAVSEHSVLLRLRTRSSMERGADIAWLSAFPSEAECLFPPLTYLQPVGESEVALGDVNFRVIVVEPRM